MGELLDSIHVAVADDASDDDRRRGATACRALADALESACTRHDYPAPSDVGPILEIEPEPELVPAPESPAPALLNNLFAGMSADQVLELAIAKLRNTVGETPAPARPPVPTDTRPRSEAPVTEAV